jgi:hypothetical protein
MIINKLFKFYFDGILNKWMTGLLLQKKKLGLDLIVLGLFFIMFHGQAARLLPLSGKNLSC